MSFDILLSITAKIFFSVSEITFVINPANILNIKSITIIVTTTLINDEINIILTIPSPVFCLYYTIIH